MAIQTVPQIETPCAIQPRGFSYADAAKYCGVSISFLRSAVWSKKLDPIVAGNHHVFLREALDEFLDGLRDGSVRVATMSGRGQRKSAKEPRLARRRAA